MTRCTPSRKLRRPARAQRGVVLFISLIILVAMTLAGIGMVRSVDTGTLVAGNLAFKQSATHGADSGVEAGITWLTGTGASLVNADQSRGYFANWQTDFVPATFDWDTLGSTPVVDSRTGNSVSYIIHRMCQFSGQTVNAPTQTCVSLSSSTVGGSKGGAVYGQRALSGTIQAYYRITARAVGPRNSVSYVQAVVY